MTQHNRIKELEREISRELTKIELAEAEIRHIKLVIADKLEKIEALRHDLEDLD